MKEADEILRMIETVSPDDTVKLDEIDARVWCLQEGSAYCADLWHSPDIPKVSRSRDAMKVIIQSIVYERKQEGGG